ncbi:hypothetical protein BVRB_016680, partial [Beta vulgaris subsp. vulgaris]
VPRVTLPHRCIHYISNKTNLAKSRLPNSDSGWSTNVKFDAKGVVIITGSR